MRDAVDSDCPLRPEWAEVRVDGEPRLESTQAMDRFLAGVECRAYRMAWIATRNREDALDIVQDAMLRLVKRYAGRPEAEWGPLFQRIMQSAIHDWYRRSRVRNRWRQWLGIAKGPMDDERLGDPLETTIASHAPGPEGSLASQHAIDALDAALHALPLRQQQVFLLRQWEGLSVADTAYAMGISAGSVKTHYSRAVQTLRGKLEDHRP